jgi:DNA-binding NarL/FixJ family response regulator
MNNLQEIIAKRSEPGVLILDLEDRLLYSNQQALEMLRVLQLKHDEQPVPAEIYDLCRKLRGGSNQTATVCGVIHHMDGESGAAQYSLRALRLGGHGERHDASHIMVLMENVIRNRQIELEQAQEKFRLSKRETEVVRLICQGLGNKDISGSICVSEFTVKDHLKNIMRKMGVGSRNEIIAILLS